MDDDSAHESRIDTAEAPQSRSWIQRCFTWLQHSRKLLEVKASRRPPRHPNKRFTTLNVFDTPAQSLELIHYLWVWLDVVAHREGLADCESSLRSRLERSLDSDRIVRHSKLLTSQQYIFQTRSLKHALEILRAENGEPMGFRVRTRFWTNCVERLNIAKDIYLIDLSQTNLLNNLAVLLGHQDFSRLANIKALGVQVEWSQFVAGSGWKANGWWLFSTRLRSMALIQGSTSIGFVRQADRPTNTVDTSGC